MEYRVKIKNLKKRLKILKKEMKVLEKKEGEILSKLNALQKEERLLDSLIRLYKERKKQLEKEIKFYSVKIKGLEDTLGMSQKNLEESIVFLYKYRNKMDYKTFIFKKAYAKFAYYNLYSIKKSLRWSKAIRQKKEELERKKEELNEIELDIARKSEELKKNKIKQKKLLEKIKKEKKMKEMYIKEVKQSIARLENLIKKLTLKKKRVKKWVRKKVLLPDIKIKFLPVNGKIVSHFGTIWKGRYRVKIKNKGIDIKTYPFSEVKAVDKGEVLYADEFLGYGKLVIIDHNKFFGVYANLSEIYVLKGDKIPRGAVIGKVGKNGILHFEVRVEGKAYNPLNFLAQR